VPFRCRVLVLTLLASVAMSGCGGVGGEMIGRAQPSNSTDAAFVRAMIAHERATASIARLGREKALRVELRGIARDTLTRHNRNVPHLNLFEAALRGSRVSLVSSYIRGRPPRFDARQLRGAVSFDHDFMVRMIEQHRYAMTTAAAERDHGSDARVKALAAEMYDSSRRDLAKLQRWLRTWYGDTQPPPSPRGPAPAPDPGGGGGQGAPAPGPEV
jgi:uncharacterized protein (DUF305 family)